jgi:uroporphyrinogen-III decarboxylase
MLQATVDAHNAEAQAVWDAFNAGSPARPPVALGTATQFFIFNEELNPGEAVTFEDYCADAATMLEFQLRAAWWRSENIAPYCDDRIGMPPNREAWLVRVDLQNFDEAAHLGAPVVFMRGQAPDTRPILAGDRKNALFDAGMPDPLYGGWYRRAHDILEQWQERLRREPEHAGWPVRIDPFGWWSGGPLTLAVSLRGHELLTDLYEDPEYVRALLSYLTDATIARVRAHARFFALPDPPDSLWFADDALQMLSVRMAREFMLPIYRRMKAEMTTAQNVKIHLCGDATRHFGWLKDELGVNDFETGFPVDHAKVRRELGPDVTIHGGPTVMILRDGTPEAVAAETRRILDSGVCERGRFVLREANNLAPGTPVANLSAMYETARRWGGERGF